MDLSINGLAVVLNSLTKISFLSSITARSEDIYIYIYISKQLNAQK